jgi:hypothetical protein
VSFIAALFAIAALWALVSGRANWFTGSVSRADSPLAYWASIVVCLLVAAALMSIGPVR